MPETCIAFGCSMRTGTNLLSEVKMFRFPKDPVRRSLWEIAVRRKNWKPTPNSRLCNLHFITGRPSKDPLHPDYVPSIFCFSRATQNSTAISRYDRSRKRKMTGASHFSDMENNDAMTELPMQIEIQQESDSVSSNEKGNDHSDATESVEVVANHSNSLSSVKTEMENSSGDALIKNEKDMESTDAIESVEAATNHANSLSSVKTEKESATDSVSIKNEVDEKDATGEGNKSPNHDPFSYTKLNDFTSEIYKIEINNLPNYVGYGQLRKLLNVTLKLNPCKIKAIGSPPQFVFTTFRSEEDRDKALNSLNGYVWKGRALVAKKANPAADPMVQKRKAGDSEDCPGAKKLKEDDIPVELKLKNAVTPYWNIPYEEQLKMKESDIRKFLVSLGRALEKTNRNLHSILQKHRKENNYQCCPLSAIKQSPATTAYRNKCEFTVGRHLRTKEKTVGFRLSSYKAGSMSVAEPDDCINISSEMLKAVKSFQDYVRSSDKDVYNPENHEGYWRQLTVRTSRNCDILLIAVMHPQSLSEDELAEEKSKLKEYYEIGPGSKVGITSVYFQLFSKKGCSDDTPNLTHLMGKKTLEESLLGMKFQISPEAFFQINVPATEVLYSMVTEYAQATSDATVLDVCCGTGTISLCLAKAGAKVIGIEMCPEAVENARLNAKNNGVTNVDFICGKAEDVIMTAIQKCEGSSDIIAVVDPPRAGLHQKVVKAIRATTRIKKLIYIACNPNCAKNNFIDLCRAPSNNYRGQPFYPSEAAVVDMFPYTPHKELVLIFERCP